MMDYGNGQGAGWMWAFGGVLMIGILLLIGVAVWAVITMVNRSHRTHAAATPSGFAVPVVADPQAPTRLKQTLDERYARGELTTEEYTERLRTLGL